MQVLFNVTIKRNQCHVRCIIKDEVSYDLWNTWCSNLDEKCIKTAESTACTEFHYAIIHLQSHKTQGSVKDHLSVSLIHFLCVSCLEDPNSNSYKMCIYKSRNMALKKEKNTEMYFSCVPLMNTGFSSCSLFTFHFQMLFVCIEMTAQKRENLSYSDWISVNEWLQIKPRWSRLKLWSYQKVE